LKKAKTSKDVDAKLQVYGYTTMTAGLLRVKSENAIFILIDLLPHPQIGRKIIMTTMFKKFATGTAALALMTTVFASTTLAAEGTSTTEIKGTESVTLTGVSTSNFDTVQLDGTTQTTTAKLDITSIIDARGTGDGWNVTVKAAPLSQGENGNVLSENKLTLALPAVQKVDVGSSEVSTITTKGGNIDNANGVNILTAQDNGGMGSFTIDPIPMTLTLLPKEVFAGNYSTTVSVELTAGPQS